MLKPRACERRWGKRFSIMVLKNIIEELFI